ncbi:hypothetical protein LX36DRAFT_448601 [Colletotrichum falcatum]|nr:hypothetical protein LX36DRAFT_448601 [Colletotrichum falcatum]
MKAWRTSLNLYTQHSGSSSRGKMSTSRAILAPGSRDDYHPSGGSLPYRRRPGRRLLLACSVSSTLPPPTLVVLHTLVSSIAETSSLCQVQGFPVVSHAQRSGMKCMQMTCLFLLGGRSPSYSLPKRKPAGMFGAACRVSRRNCLGLRMPLAE